MSTVHGIVIWLIAMALLFPMAISIGAVFFGVAPVESMRFFIDAYLWKGLLFMMSLGSVCIIFINFLNRVIGSKFNSVGRNAQDGKDIQGTR